jgi:hypothetical protein
MVSGSDQAIHGIFADNDSENEDEFQGLGPGDIYIDKGNKADDIKTSVFFFR